MQTKTRNALVMIAAVAVGGAGLALVAKNKRPLAVGLRGKALDAIPSGALLVATADLGALRASPVGAPFLREGREIKGVGKVNELCGFDPLDALTDVAIGIPADGETGDFGLAASGDVDDKAIVACASKVIEARGGTPVTTTFGSFHLVRDASLDGGGEIAVRKGGPLLLGGGAYLHEMIDAAEGRGRTVRSSLAHGMLASEVGEAPVRVTVVLTPEQRRTLAEELESGGAKGDPIGSVRAAGAGVTLGATVSVHAVLSCDAAPACAAVARKLAEMRDEHSKDLALRLVGFGALLERVTIEPKGDLVHARVELPAEEAATLADRLVTLRGVRHPMPGDDKGKRRPPREADQPVPPVQPDEVVKPAADGGAAASPSAKATATPSARPSAAPR